MYFKTSTLAAAVIAVSAFAAHAQSSSTPSMAPTTGGAAKTETPAPDAKGATAQPAPTPSQTSSNPTMAPNPGGAAKTEAPGANAKTTAPAKLENPPSQSSSTPAMAPTKN